MIDMDGSQILYISSLRFMDTSPYDLFIPVFFIMIGALRVKVYPFIITKFKPTLTVKSDKVALFN